MYLILGFLLIVVGLAQFTIVDEIENGKHYGNKNKPWFMNELFSYSMVLPLMGGLVVLVFAILERHIFLILLALILMAITGFHLTVRTKRKRSAATTTLISGILIILYLFVHSQI